MTKNKIFSIELTTVSDFSLTSGIFDNSLTFHWQGLIYPPPLIYNNFWELYCYKILLNHLNLLKSQNDPKELRSFFIIN